MRDDTFGHSTSPGDPQHAAPADWNLSAEPWQRAAFRVTVVLALSIGAFFGLWWFFEWATKAVN